MCYTYIYIYIHTYICVYIVTFWRFHGWIRFFTAPLFLASDTRLRAATTATTTTTNNNNNNNTVNNNNYACTILILIIMLILNIIQTVEIHILEQGTPPPNVTYDIFLYRSISCCMFLYMSVCFYRLLLGCFAGVILNRERHRR